MITITIRPTDIWKKSITITYSAKIFLELDYQTVHTVATEQMETKSNAAECLEEAEKSAYGRRNHITFIQLQEFQSSCFEQKLKAQPDET